MRAGALVDRNPDAALNRGSILHLVLQHAVRVGTDSGLPEIDTERATILFGQKQVDDPAVRTELLAAAQHTVHSDAYLRLLDCATIHREQQFHLRLDDTHYLKGFMDAVGYDVDGTAYILDYKSGTKVADDPETLRASYRDQADCYALVALSGGAPAAQICFIRPEVMVDSGRAAGGEAEPPRPQTFSFSYASGDVAALRERIRAVIGDMEQAATASTDQVDRKLCKNHCQVPARICAVKRAFKDERKQPAQQKQADRDPHPQPEPHEQPPDGGAGTCLPGRQPRPPGAGTP
jgi:hypothetical protein